MLRGWDLQAPRVGFEPTTLRLTAGCSTIELPRNNAKFIIIYIAEKVNKNQMIFLTLSYFCKGYYS